jgi:hypothetical protein
MTMATTSHTPLPEVSAPEAPGPRQAGGRFATRAALSWAAVLAAFAAAVALAVVTLTGSDDTNPVTGDHSGLIEHGSIRSIEGSVEDSLVARGRLAPDEYAPNDYPHGFDYGSVEDRVADGPVASDAPPGLAEHGSIRSIEGSVEDASSC